MKNNDLIYTSISISKEREHLLKECAKKLDIDFPTLLSILCYKAGRYCCDKFISFKTVDYQKRGDDYVNMPVLFFASDHEYIHGHRHACKVSVSFLLALAIDRFINEIMEKGINQVELAHLRVIQNSYKKKTYGVRDLELSTNQNAQFREFVMKITHRKT